MSASNLSAVTKAASASAISGRTRMVSIYYTSTSTASSFVLRNGSTDAGTALVTINTPAAAGAYDIILPDMGILFNQGIYIDFANSEVTSVTLFFDGGAAS